MRAQTLGDPLVDWAVPDARLPGAKLLAGTADAPFEGSLQFLLSGDSEEGRSNAAGALGNLALTIVESAIGWMCILRADSLIPFFECVRFGLVPTGIMLAALPLTYASAYFCPAAE